MLGVTPQTIRNLIKAGTLSYIKNGKQYFLLEEQVERCAESIKEIYAATVDIEKYKASIADLSARIKDQRDTLKEIENLQKYSGIRLQRIVECLSIAMGAFADLGALSERESIIVCGILGGVDLSILASRLQLTKERIRQIWARCLRLYRYTKKDKMYAEIKRLRKELEREKDKGETLCDDGYVNTENMSVRLKNALFYLGIHTIKEMREARINLIRVRNVGKKTIDEYDAYLRKFGVPIYQ